MLNHTDLKRGTLFVLNGQPYEVLDYALNFQGRGSSTVTVKIKNLITRNTLSKTLHPSDQFEEADVSRKDLRLLYANKGQYYFSESEGPAKRFSLLQEQIGAGGQFLKPNDVVKGVVFADKIINIELPIKVQLKVIEAPPGLRAGRAEAGTKQVTVEGGAKINVPIFINEGDVIEINTYSSEYLRRVEK